MTCQDSAPPRRGTQGRGGGEGSLWSGAENAGGAMVAMWQGKSRRETVTLCTARKLICLSFSALGKHKI